MPYDSDALLALVPYLRRHARLLTGSKEVGDEYVRLCLELITAEPERLEGGELRVQLFAAFHASWHALNQSAEPASVSTDQQERLEQGLAALVPSDRRILLLSVVEDFTVEEVAQIVGQDAAQIKQRLREAHRNLDRFVRVPVLIIEDEAMIAMELKELIESMGLSVIKVVARQEQAIAAAESQKPGLVLSDIQLQDDGSGIEAARDILQRYEDVPIVFVTGFPERLLTGEGLEPAFVVAKPFKEMGLKIVIAQALTTYSEPASAVKHRAELLAKLRLVSARELREKVARIA
jgi:FixJ family two-component response regulator/DNA-directed RNA polymerase specialized sigma24 family protein